MKLNSYSAIALFVIISLFVGGFTSAHATYTPKGEVVNHSFSAHKLPRTTSPQAMINAGYVLKNVAEIGGRPVYYNWIAEGKAEIRRFDDGVLLWCVKDGNGTYTAVFKSICYNPVEQLPEQQVRQVTAAPCSQQEYVQQSLQQCDNTSYAGYASALCDIAQNYMQYLPQSQQYVQSRCGSEGYAKVVNIQRTVVDKSVHITNVDNSINGSFNTTRINRGGRPGPTPCPPLIAKTGSNSFASGATNPVQTDANGNTQTPYRAPGDPTNGVATTTAGMNRRQKQQAALASAQTQQPATQAGALRQQAKAAQVAQVEAAPAAKTVAGPNRIAQAQVAQQTQGSQQVAKVQPAAKVAAQGQTVGQAQASHFGKAGVAQASVPAANARQNAGSVPQATTFARGLRGAGSSSGSVGNVPRAGSFGNLRTPSASSFRVPQAKTFAGNMRTPKVGGGSFKMPHINNGGSSFHVPKMNTGSFRMPSVGGGGHFGGGRRGR